MPNQTKQNVFHVIKDPVHGSMQFTRQEANWILPFVDHENFQRLRHIKQAGLCDWFFPGAVHTRFNHSVGCCYVASQIANKIGLKAEEKQTVMIACLLHDIGHGPFSHVFEHVFYRKAIKHEMWTPYFLKDFSEKSVIAQVNKHSREVPLNNARLNLISRIIMHEEKTKTLLADIVSSQLDADRLDYLLRDSHFCGVNYGQFDFRWLLHCLTIVNNRGSKRLGVVSAGVGAVEHYLMARRLMTQNVYQHRKKFASEFFLIQFLKYLALGLEEDERFEPLQYRTLATFIKQVNIFNDNIRDTNNSDRLVQSFLKNNYDLYKTLCDYDVFAMIRHCASLNFTHPAVDLAKRLQTRNLPKVFNINAEHQDTAKEIVRAVKERCRQKIQKWQLKMLSMPHQSYQAERDPVLVRDESGKVRRLHDHSIVMKAVSDQWETASLVCIDQAILPLPEVQKLCQKLRKFS